jgi:hypothetical protein
VVEDKNEKILAINSLHYALVGIMQTRGHENHGGKGGSAFTSIK